LTNNWSKSLSNLNTAKANLTLAEITKNRYEGLLKRMPCLSRTRIIDWYYNANKAIVDANQAQREAVQALQSFERYTLRSMESSPLETPILATLSIRHM